MTQNQRQFRSKDICKLLNISQRQLVYWAERNIIKPDIEDSNGHNSTRIYSIRNVVQLELIKQLSELGISISNIRKHIENMKSYGDVCRISHKNCILTMDINSIKTDIQKKIID